MTDKITKQLTKLNIKERELVKTLLLQLKDGNTTGLNITRLKGHEDIFRLRKGRLRIIYRQVGASLSVLTIERRSEKTYRDF